MSRLYFVLTLAFIAASLVSGTLTPKKEISIKAKSLGRHQERGVNYANFKVHKNWKLKLHQASFITFLLIAFVAVFGDKSFAKVFKYCLNY